MTSSQLPNYLLASRKRLGLSQREVAFLLGGGNEAQVCRYERFVRVPSLETALACEAIFQKPARELFAGLYRKIETDVADRAATLSRQTAGGKSNSRSVHRRQRLTAIATASVKQLTDSA